MALFGPMMWQKLNRALGLPSHGRGNRFLLQCRQEWCKMGKSLNGATRHGEPDAVTEPKVSICKPLCLLKGESLYRPVEKECVSITLRKEEKTKRIFIHVYTYIRSYVCTKLGKITRSHHIATCGSREGLSIASISCAHGSIQLSCCSQDRSWAQDHPHA